MYANEAQKYGQNTRLVLGECKPQYVYKRQAYKITCAAYKPK